MSKPLLRRPLPPKELITAETKDVKKQHCTLPREKLKIKHVDKSNSNKVTNNEENIQDDNLKVGSGPDFFYSTKW